MACVQYPKRAAGSVGIVWWSQGGGMAGSDSVVRSRGGACRPTGVAGCGRQSRMEALRRPPGPVTGLSIPWPPTVSVLFHPFRLTPSSPVGVLHKGTRTHAREPLRAIPSLAQAVVDERRPWISSSVFVSPVYAAVVVAALFISHNTIS